MLYLLCQCISMFEALSLNVERVSNALSAFRTGSVSYSASPPIEFSECFFQFQALKLTAFRQCVLNKFTGVNSLPPAAESWHWAMGRWTGPQSMRSSRGSLTSSPPSVFQETKDLPSRGKPGNLSSALSFLVVIGAHHIRVVPSSPGNETTRIEYKIGCFPTFWILGRATTLEDTAMTSYNWVMAGEESDESF
jgi:hypothetical protein